MTADTVAAPRESSRGSDILEVLRRRWPIFLLLTLLGTGLGVARHERATKSYEATASLVFAETNDLPGVLGTGGGSSSGDPERQAATQVLIAKSPKVASGAARQLRITASPQQLLDHIDVEAAPNADVLRITASSRDPVFAARLANAFGRAFIAFQTESRLAAIGAAQEELRRQLATLPPEGPQAVTLRDSLQRLNELRAVAGGDTRLIGSASVPGTPSGMGLATSGVLGALIGLALAFSLVVLLESRDRRLRRLEGFEAYGLPLFGAVPERALGGRRGGDLESFRIVRSALEFVAATRHLGTLLITSAVSGEGKTTLAAGLARAYALSGRDVVLVELDLRRPTLGRHFSVDTSLGVTTVLLGQSRARDLLIEVEPQLELLPAGLLPPNPSEMLASPALGRLLAELSLGGRLVILDAPPLIPVADAQELLGHPAIDAALIVGRLGLTTTDQLRSARGVIDRHPGKAVGVVVTGIRGGDRYGYGSYASNAETPPSVPRLGDRRQASATR